MNIRLLPLILLLLFAINTVEAADEAVSGDAEKGRRLWTMKTAINDDSRSCSTCHTTNPSQPGKHIRTGKLIDPLSPSVDPKSLTDPKKVEKWFRRNCKWTLGRVCTAQEKADVLAFLNLN